MGRWGLGFPRSWSFGVPVGFEDEHMELQPRIAVDQSLPIRLHGPDPEQAAEGFEKCSPKTSTMSLSLHDGYIDWLEKKGFTFSEVFGHTSEK